MVGAVNMIVDITDRKQAEETIARHRDEQAALYQFTDGLFRACSLTDTYDAALDAIRRALGCERASILLFDEVGSMRFVAWAGLSESYRRAVDGHSPWTRDAINPQPICIPDVGASDLTASLKETVKAEGIAATAFIPLIVEGNLARQVHGLLRRAPRLQPSRYRSRGHHRAPTRIQHPTYSLR